jgi:hypothetical protein
MRTRGRIWKRRSTLASERLQALLRVLRFPGLTALFTVTVCAALLLSMSVGMLIAEWAGWGLHEIGNRLVWSWLAVAHAPFGLLMAVLAWIAAAGALYILAAPWTLGRLERRGAGARTR